MPSFRILTKAALVAVVLVAGLAIARPASAIVVAPAPWFANEYTGSSIAVGGTYKPIVGDFGGSDNDDILWFSPTGTDYLWISYGDGTFSKAAFSSQINGNYQPIVGDFGKDNRTDIFWYAPGAGADKLWLIQSGVATVVNKTVNGTYQPFVIPHSRFGMSEDQIVWYAPGSGADSLWTFTSALGAHTVTTLTVPGSPKPLVGDFDGNGFADIFWYSAGTAAESLWRSTNSTGTFTKSGFTVNGTYTPVVQDYTPGRDGRSDILFFTSGTGADPLWQGKSTGGFATSTRNISAAGTPLGLTWDWGYLWVWNTSTPDVVWYVNSSGPDYESPASHTELGTGYTPLIGTFADTKEGIFWYKAGSAPEYLMN